MRYFKLLVKRILYIIPQFIGTVVVIFFVVRLMPGDPARLMSGTNVSKEGVELMRERMGLSGPVYVQFWNYFKNLFKGDLGKSWVTGNQVLEDILNKLPSTLELIILSLIIILGILLPIALKSISEEDSWIKKFLGKTLFVYGLSAGSFADFWVALILILIFYAKLGWAPAPVGQLPIGMSVPTVTGMMLIDSLLNNNTVAFLSHIKALVLPVLVLSFIFGAGIIKMTLVTAMSVQKSDFIKYARVCALPANKINSYTKRATLPSTITISAIIFGYMIGGAVMIEIVFSWGGIGQYAVQSVTQLDYAAIQGVVLILAIINIVIYFIVDVVYLIVDPRIESLG